MPGVIARRMTPKTLGMSAVQGLSLSERKKKTAPRTIKKAAFRILGMCGFFIAWKVLFALKRPFWKGGSCTGG
jgi:hypothetical protein